MKILAIKLRAIGDTVIWTAALESLRAQFPDAEIHVLTYASNVPVLENSAAVDQIHALKSKSRWSLWGELWGLRAESFDWLLGFHITKSLARSAWLVGARKMVLHHHSWGFTPRGSERIDRPGALMDTIHRDLEVLKAMGFTPTARATHIHLAGTEKDWGEKEVRARIAACGGDTEKPRFTFLPGASHHLRRYPLDLWWPLVEKTLTQGQYQPLVMCDGELSQHWNLKELCARFKIPLFDGGTLREFMARVSAGQRALANDSGPGHVAVALGLPTDFLFGPGCVGDWFPYSSPHGVQRIEVPCRLQGPRQLEKFQFCIVEKCDHHSCMRKLVARVPQPQTSGA